MIISFLLKDSTNQGGKSGSLQILESEKIHRIQDDPKGSIGSRRSKTIQKDPEDPRGSKRIQKDPK
jgi:hypothetical protein